MHGLTLVFALMLVTLASALPAQVQMPSGPATPGSAGSQAAPGADMDRAALETAAAAGDLEAMVRLGDLLWRGEDYAGAGDWYRRAADREHVHALNMLGEAHYFGKGVPQDYARAHDWYMKAAALGSDLAAYSLGELYYNGDGVAQDHAAARGWYEKAAAAGNPHALYSLGWMNEHGEGAAVDLDAAVKHYRLATQSGKVAGMEDGLADSGFDAAAASREKLGELCAAGVGDACS